MHRIFLPIYRFFKERKALLYGLMIVSTLVFGFFASKITFEENIAKLMPVENSESELAFGNLRVKDKVFIQMTAAGEEPVSTEVLSALQDEFVEGLMAKDATHGLIDNILYRIDDDLLVSALDFALSHVPSFVDTSLYAAFDAAITPEAVFAQMDRNLAIIENDWTGDDTQMVARDPLDLKGILAREVLGDGGLAGYTIVDGHLFCPDSTVALAFLAPEFNSLNSGAGTRLARMIEKQIDEFRVSHPEVRVLFHGDPIESYNNSSRIKGDLFMTVGVSLLVILLVICICFRSVRILWQQLLPVAYGAVFSLSCMYWIKGGMSMMALGLGAIVLGVALSYCLHVIIHFYYVKGSAQMLRDESTAVCLGCITTVGAFLGLLFTKSEMLRDFGLFASFALLGNTFFALVFLPHMLSPKKLRRDERAFRVIDRISAHAFDRDRWLLVVMAVMIVFGLVYSHNIQFDSDLRHIGFKTRDLIASENLYDAKNFEGFDQLYFANTSTDLDEALQADKRMLRALDSLQALGEIHAYSGVVPQLFVPMEDQRERIAAWKAYWTPERIATVRARISAAAQERGLSPILFTPFYAMLSADYEPASLYEAGIIPESLSSNFIEKMDDGTYLVFTPVMLLQEQRDPLCDNLTPLPHTIALDPFYYCVDMVRLIHEDFNTILLISSLFVLLILLLSFRNLWIALIAFFPMFFSWYVVQAMMALLGLQFNLISIVISTFIFGIGVDYSIFVMEGLLSQARTRRQDMLVYHKVAIFFSAFVLAVVVMSLLFAVHPAIRSIGMCTLIGMASTILITYTLQPWLFRQLMKIKYFRKSFRAMEPNNL